MVDIIGDSELTCRLTGERTWRREVGYCTTADGIDINRAIIEQGAALSCPRFDPRYLPFEQPAALGGAAAHFVLPAAAVTAGGRALVTEAKGLSRGH